MTAARAVTRTRIVVATLATVIVVLAVWKFVDIRMQPPPPPKRAMSDR